MVMLVTERPAQQELHGLARELHGPRARTGELSLTGRLVRFEPAADSFKFPGNGAPSLEATTRVNVTEIAEARVPAQRWLSRLPGRTGRLELVLLDGRRLIYTVRDPRAWAHGLASAAAAERASADR